MVIIGIIVAILIFSIIVLIHEFGHFKAARFFGVKVEEFGLGIPPRAKKLWTDKKGTLYSLNYIPLGGFVRLAGENQLNIELYDKKGAPYNYERLKKDIENNIDIFNRKKKKLEKEEINEIKKLIKEKDASYNLDKKPAWQQSIIILAGVFMNFLFASIIFSILFFVGVKPIGVNTKIETDLDLKLIPNYEQALESGLIIKEKGVLIDPIEGSIARNSGLKTGQVITHINGDEIISPSMMIEKVNNNKGGNITISGYAQNPDYEGGCECLKNITFQVSLIVGKDGKIGTYIGDNIVINNGFEYKFSVLNSIKYGFGETYNQSLLTLKALGTLLGKIINPQVPEERQEAINQVSGPIGLVNFISTSISGGIIFIVILTAIISINLGVFNLLPIPALDGGRFIFILLNSFIQKISGKRKGINQNIEGLIHALFFILLIALSIIIAYNDIAKIVIEKN